MRNKGVWTVTLDDRQLKAGSSALGLFERTHTRRDVLKGAAGAGALLALGPLMSACGESTTESPSSTGSSAPVRGGSLTSAISGGSTKEDLDAHSATIEPQYAMHFILYDPLLGYDPQQRRVNLLAESLEVSPDAKIYTVRLKPGLEFHNGKTVTADDVVYTFKRILDPDNPKINASMLSDLPVSGIKKLDELTVRFTLDSANAAFPDALANYNSAIVPVGYDNKGVKDAIGTGPFKIESHTPNEKAEFSANENYWGEGPYVDTLTLLQFTEPTARLNALLGGSADHMTMLQPAQVEVVTASTGFEVLEAKAGSWVPFTMRIDRKPYDDVRVRQAFRLIVDRQQMIDQAVAGYGWLGNDMYAVYDPGYPKDLPQREQDLEQARALLKQAGYDNDLTVTLDASEATSSDALAIAQVFAEQAKGAGVTVNVNKVDPSVFYGEQFTQWDFALDSWGTRPYLAQTMLATMPGAPWSETHWENDEWYAIVREAMATGDEDKRNELIGQAQTIEYNEGGYIIWSFATLLDAYSDKLGGLVPDVWHLSASRWRYNLMYFNA